MKKLQLIDILRKQIANEQQFIELMENEQNPQIVEMVNKAKGKIDAFEDVLYYAKYNSTLMFTKGLE